VAFAHSGHFASESGFQDQAHSALSKKPEPMGLRPHGHHEGKSDMPLPNLVHTKRLTKTNIRELSVYYDKGGLNYWNHSQKPKGIYFSTGLYEQVPGSGIKSWKTGQKGDGYILVTPLERYSRKALRLVRERVEKHADQIHTMFEQGGDVENLKALLRGEAFTPVVTSANAETAKAEA